MATNTNINKVIYFGVYIINLMFWNPLRHVAKSPRAWPSVTEGCAHRGCPRLLILPRNRALYWYPPDSLTLKMEAVYYYVTLATTYPTSTWLPKHDQHIPWHVTFVANKQKYARFPYTPTSALIQCSQRYRTVVPCQFQCDPWIHFCIGYSKVTYFFNYKINVLLKLIAQLL